MKCGMKEGPVFASGKHLCGVCKKAVDRNSLYGSFWKNWVQKRCSGFKGRLIDAPDFKCHSCLLPPESEKEECKFKLDNFYYERVDKSCYLRDMSSGTSGAEASSIT